MRIAVVALVLLLLSPGSVAGQYVPAPQVAPPTTSSAPALRTMRAARLLGAIHLDGRLDEAAWQAAPVERDFTQSYPTQGAPPIDPTEVRVLYDEKAIYVGITMFDSHPDSIAAQLARRDAIMIYSDWAHVSIDSYHDRRTAFRFSVNPRGVKKDVYTSNNSSEDLNWDAVWEVATRVDSTGWVAEYRIPLSQLRFGSAPAGAERTWGIQVMREIARRNERDAWSPWTPQSPGLVSSFGDLTGLIGVRAPQRLEVLPYTSFRATHGPGDPANPFFKSTDTKPSGGLDIRYGLPQGLTFTGTVNPDFGQVEADPAVVNLTAFETFFPEQRPFFLEGGDAFSFGRIQVHNDYSGQQFFYSRRIGRAPQRSPYGPGVVYADAPGETTIAGAGKITGRAGQWTIGLLDAVTPEERAELAFANGTRGSTAVEPATNYFAGRAKRDFNQGASSIGFMGTWTARAVGSPVFTNLLRNNAYFAGVDFEHSWRQRTWVVMGFLAGTRVTGSAPVMAATQQNSTHYFQRPDASHLSYDATRTRLGGHIGEIALIRNGTWFGSAAYKQVSPGLELNDLGFMGRADYRAFSTIAGYQNYRAGRLFRQYYLGVGTNSAWNFGGLSIFQSALAFFNGTLANLWSGNLNLSVSPGYQSDRFTRGGPVADVPASWSANGRISTDSRKPVILTLGGSYSHDASAAAARSIFLGFEARPTSFLRLSVSPSYASSKSTGQYIRTMDDPLATATYGRRYVFADLKQTTVSMTTRIEWTFTPTLSFQLYAQPFLSSGRYSRIKEFARPGSYDFAVYGVDRGTIARDATSRAYSIDPDGSGAAPGFSVDNPDFNFRSLRGNAVVRWEYRPGSTLFFVWQQQRSDAEPFGDFEFSRDVSALFHAPATNVFLVKASYWIGR